MDFHYTQLCITVARAWCANEPETQVSHNMLHLKFGSHSRTMLHNFSYIAPACCCEVLACRHTHLYCYGRSPPNNAFIRNAPSLL